jgi:hypothetical protein
MNKTADSYESEMFEYHGGEALVSRLYCADTIVKSPIEKGTDFG